MTAEQIFTQQVIPIMDKVAAELSRRQVEEYRKDSTSLRSLFSGGVGPDGGMAVASMDYYNLKRHGEWNSKTVEDYVQMVSKELCSAGIEFTPELQSLMMEKMVRDQMPKSSVEYVMRKAAESSIFNLPNDTLKSPLQHEIERKAEELYAPSTVEKGLGWGLGAAADFMAFGGSSVASGLKFVGVDMALNAGLEALENGLGKGEDGQSITSEREQEEVPLVVLPQYREQYLAENQAAQAKRTTLDESDAEQVVQSTGNQVESSVEAQVQPSIVPHSKQSINDALKGLAQRSSGVVVQSAAQNEVPTENLSTERTDQYVAQVQTPETATIQQASQRAESAAIQPPPQSNTNGWQGVFSNFGLNGLSDIGRNMGYIMAMLPDMLVGLLTGKTKSLGLKENLMPIASIMLGMFVKNPLLKLTLIGMGGANLLNKAGHEELDRVRGIEYGSENSWGNTQQRQQGQNQSSYDGEHLQNQYQNTQYRPYAAESLNPRLENPQIQGNVMVVSIDKIPVTVTLPDKVISAYQSGALPLSTLANAVLTKADQMQQLSTAQDRFEAETRTTTQSLTQR